jgi:ATP-dependent protease HslVU (ClpYQ) ATPase subunit
MALTTEQQATVDMQIAVENARHTNQMELIAQQNSAIGKQAKLEAVRLAKDVLIENARSKAVDSRDVAATDITAFAQTLVAYIDT